MALKYLSNIDLGGLEIQNAKPYVITTADQTNLADSSHASYLGTGAANIGKMYWNSQTLTFLIWKGTGWVVLDGSGDISSVSLVSDSGTLLDSAGAVAFTIAGDTGISTTATGSTLKIDLDDVTRTNSAGTANVEYGGTIAPITSLTTNDQGQVTAATTTTITLPDLGTGSTEALPGNTDILDVSNAHLLTRLAALESPGGNTDQDITIGADAGDTIVITGNLQVAGTTTTVNSTTVTIADKNLTVASGATTSATTNGAGLTFSAWSAAPTLTWNHASSYLAVNKNFYVGGDITLSGTVDGIDIATDVAANTLKETNVTTNLSNTPSSTTLVVESSDGGDTTLPVATTSAGGVMSAAQVTALNLATTPTEVTAQIDTYSQSFILSGDGSATSFDSNHGWTTFKVMVEILDYGNAGSSATYATVHADVIRHTEEIVRVTFAVAPSTTQDYLVLLTKVTN